MQYIANIFIAFKKSFLYIAISIGIIVLLENLQLKGSFWDVIYVLVVIFCGIGPIAYYFYTLRGLNKIYKYKTRQGITNYVPLFYYMVDPKDDKSFKECVGLLGKTELIICKADSNIAHRLEGDFWDSIGKELMSIPYSLIVELNVITRNQKEYKSDRSATFWSDLIINKTLGTVLGMSGTTIHFAAYAYMVVRIDQEDHSLVFAVSNKSGGIGAGMNIIEKFLPEAVTRTISIGESALEFCEIHSDDIEEVQLAKAVCRTLAIEISESKRYLKKARLVTT